MTPRDRILTVLNGGIADRVPVTLFIMDEGHFLSQVYPDYDINDYIGNKLKVIDLQREFEADIHMRIWGGCVPLWLMIGGFNTEASTGDWKVEKKVFTRGKSKVTASRAVTPEGELNQEFTISEFIKGTRHYACTKKPVNSIKDLTLMERYEPSMREDYPGHISDIVSKTKEYLGDDGIISMWIPGGLFNHCSRLIDLDTLYMLYLTDKAFYERLMDFSFNRVKPFIKAITDTDLDLLNMGGNTAGGFLGAKIFEENVLPYEKKLIEFIHSLDKKVLYHNCGPIMNLAASYTGMGADIIETFSPPPLLGDADLKKAKELSEGKYIIIGNIDQVNVIKDGDPVTIRNTVKEAVEAGKPGGKFILQPSDFLEYDTPLENVRAFIKAGKEYGQYK
jgi:uroporphyrinogen decarboxylase